MRGLGRAEACRGGTRRRRAGGGVRRRRAATRQQRIVLPTSAARGSPGGGGPQRTLPRPNGACQSVTAVTGIVRVTIRMSKNISRSSFPSGSGGGGGGGGAGQRAAGGPHAGGDPLLAAGRVVERLPRRRTAPRPAHQHVGPAPPHLEPEQPLHPVRPAVGADHRRRRLILIRPSETRRHRRGRAPLDPSPARQVAGTSRHALVAVRGRTFPAREEQRPRGQRRVFRAEQRLVPPRRSARPASESRAPPLRPSCRSCRGSSAGPHLRRYGARR